LAIALLSVGVGVTTAMFAIVNGVLLRPLRYPRGERLVIAGEMDVNRKPVSDADYFDWAEQNTVFEALGAYENLNANVVLSGGAERVRVTAVTASLFDVLRSRPLVGRLFGPEEEARHEKVAVLSDGLWTRAYGRSRRVVGSSLWMDGDLYVILGVLPGDPGLFTGTEVWIPERLNPSLRGHRFYWALARLRAGMTIKQAQTGLADIARRLAEAYPATNKGYSAFVVGARDWLVGDMRDSLRVACGAIWLVLLMACANVATIQLARQEKRQQEVAVRTSLGASRLQLVAPLLAENLVLALTGGVVGVLVAVGSLQVILASPLKLPRSAEIQVDAQVLVFALLASLLSGIIFGAAPLCKLLRVDMLAGVRQGYRTSTGSAGSRIGRLIVITEIALAVMLLSTATLCFESLSAVRRVDPGFRTSGLWVMDLTIPYFSSGTVGQQGATLGRLLTRVRALPGVESASAINRFPIGAFGLSSTFQLADKVLPNTEAVQFRLVDGEYFKVMRIPVLNGRAFDDRDAAQQPRVAVISQAMARRYWPAGNPIGARLRLTGGAWTTVVGIVGDVRQFSLTQPPVPLLYLPAYQNAWPGEMTLIVASRLDSASLLSSLRAEVRRVDVAMPVSLFRRIDEVLSRSWAIFDFNAELLGVFAALAVGLAGVGVYGIVAYSVRQRSHDIGVRMALGARGVDILRMIMADTLRTAGLGIAVGLPGGYALARLISNLLYGVQASDPLAFASAGILAFAASLLAGLTPAYRASRLDPNIVLRHE
jgi:putative ABC transport system permease protein